VLGGEGHNILIGDDDEDLTLTGNDRLEGRSGVDTIFGGPGNDRLNGREGDDLLDGGDGNDFIFGGLGNDVMIGGAGADIINGSYGDDIILGGSETDQIFGSDGNDLLIGGTGSDRVRGDGGDDDVIGGTSEIDSAIEAAFDELLAELGSSLSDHDTAVAAAVNAWLTTGTNRSGFGSFDDSDAIDVLTGDIGVDEFHSDADSIRDLRSDDRIITP
jgi:Ca2+-binding RTX toxin-like protein